MKRILSIFIAVVFAISLVGFVSAESNQSTQLTAQMATPAPVPFESPAPGFMETPAPTPTKAPVKKHHKKRYHKRVPKPTPASE